MVLLVITHRHGENRYLLKGKRAAHRAVKSFAREWWAQEMGKLPPKRLTWEQINHYFEVADEGYEIETIKIEKEA